MKRLNTIILVFIGIILVQLACNAPVPIPLTGAGGTNTPTRIVTTGTPSVGACTNKATFINDVTIPDNTQMTAGQVFTKTWRVRNDGTCAWGPSGYPVSGMVFTGGEPMGGPKEVLLPVVVQPGETVDVSVQLTAPETPGTYISQWMFKLNDNGSGAQTLGVGDNGKGRLYVQIVVK